MSREIMEFDVVIVGAGPSGLACGIKLKQLNPDLGICIIEKGSEVGAHILSGAVIETRALAELFPDWQAMGAPLNTPALKDEFLFLSEKRALPLPTPPQMHNQGNYIISLGNLCRWLGTEAESLGVEIYPGFAAAEVLYAENGQVTGVATGDMGIGKDGNPTSNHTPGVELRARQTIFAEGCRGSLTKNLFEQFDLRKDCDPQTYGIGIKELWEGENPLHSPGLIRHTVGWPLDDRTYGGSFLYHLQDNLMAVGFVVGLDYRNPHISPFEEFQRFKTHPAIRDHFLGRRRIAYGARALSEGGLQSIPKLTFPGGLLIGDTAGFLNVPKIKGTHTAMMSGILAASAVNELLKGEGLEAAAYETNLRNSWIKDELFKARNIRPAFAKYGLWGGIAYSAVDTYLFGGKAPWTFHHHPDHSELEAAHIHPRTNYPKPDGTLTFDRLSSVFISNTNHEENQPSHLKLKRAEAAIDINLYWFAAPETRYCPAGVYEIMENKLVINAQNCLHCKTCDIKDPTQNINWTTPEGGGGPNYSGM